MIMSATLVDFALRFPLIVAKNVVYAIKNTGFRKKTGVFLTSREKMSASPMLMVLAAVLVCCLCTLNK